MNGWTRSIVGMRAAAGRAMSPDAAKTVGTASAGRRGFTLVEVIISIGAVAIVSVGLAAIFQTIGATVTQGQKVSALTQAAAVLEQQMRRDFAGMTREGFLVIRNQFAGPRDGSGPGGQFWDVGINKDDANPRPRRVDELLFFAKGEYETARAPINPSMVARGDTAMVYYGHVLFPRHRDTNGDGRFDPQDVRPSVSSLNDPDPARVRDTVNGRDDLYAFGGGGSFGESYQGRSLPNTYAENWVLGRKLTILASPKSLREDFPTRGWPAAMRLAATGGAPRNRLSENEVQIATQPAASSIFRSMARVVSIVAPGAQAQRNQLARSVTGSGADRGAAFPQLSSGLVDIATIDLNEIRTIVQTFEADPWDAGLLTKYNSVAYTTPGLPNATWDTKFRVNIGGSPDIDRMHAWMEDAFPTQSDRFGRNDPTDPRGARVRAEIAPPDYLNVLKDLQGAAGEDAVALLARRADQSMLTQGAVATRCTEFIVEWSFGTAEDNVQNGPNVQWFGTGDTSQRFSQYDDSQRKRHTPFADRRGLSASVAGHYVRKNLIYGLTPPLPTQTQTAHFGFYDPYYVPQVDAQGNVNGLNPLVLPWAWPKLVRVTVALVDEREPLKEERFQWVFEMPGTPDAE